MFIAPAQVKMSYISVRSPKDLKKQHHYFQMMKLKAYYDSNISEFTVPGQKKNTVYLS